MGVAGVRPVDVRRGEYVVTPLGHVAEVLNILDDGRVNLRYLKAEGMPNDCEVMLFPQLLYPWNGGGLSN